MTEDLLSDVSPRVRGMLGPLAPEVTLAADDFSADRRFRYSLVYHWPGGTVPQPLIVVGQNPSTASRDRTDATVLRCARRAHRGGFGGLVMLNMFPLVATDPADLWAAGPQPIEEDANLRGIGAWLRGWPRPSVLLAPGGDPHPRHRAMAVRVEALLRAHGAQLLCLGVTAGGLPRHPSRLGYDVPMTPWRGSFAEAC